MGGFTKENVLAAKRGYTYRITRRQFLVATSAAALAACAPAAVTPGASGSPAATPGKALKIGQLLPFTGVYAELGNSMRRATELYLKQNDQKIANRPVTIVYEDDTNVTATGIQKTQKFIDQDQVDVMLGVVPTPLAYGIRNAVHAAKLIFIDTNAGGNALTRDTPDCKPACKSPYIFRSSFSSYQISYPIGDYLSAKGTKEFFLAYANYGFGTESAADFTTGLKKNGGSVTGNVAPPLGNADFAPFVTQIKNQPTKNVYSFFSGADAIGFIKTWNQLGLPAAGYKMYGAGFLTEQDVLKEVKDLANGAITSLFWAVELDNAENKKFVADFQKQYPLLPDVFAVQAYDGMTALGEALKKIGGDTSDKDKLVKALEDVSFKSPRGDFTFDKTTHNPIQDIYLREVKTQGGQTVNTILDKIAKVTDPGK
ncbi:MAG TPA: ABC transporter substrate-binding protein [Candidatus Limnocylindria bacterium]|jgi:branched-chain amino acid transport system substrate-binding protein|nr:ABC transporter substrate-binding protein [Candidatus Limnocylindria bacterium]